MSFVVKFKRLWLNHCFMYSQMYWSDWVMHPASKTAKIETALMDGSQRKTLTINKTQWPNGMSLDRENQKLYWTEAFYDSIHSINTDGTNFQVIFISQVK